MRTPTLVALWLCLFGILAPRAVAEGVADCAVDGLRCDAEGDGYDVRVEVAVPGSATAPVTVEVRDTAGAVYRQVVPGPGRHALTFRLASPVAEATIDPLEAVGDPDRYNNHLPRRVVVTPWPAAPTDAYLLRYFPGLTFKQGQAPVRPQGAPMMPPAQGPMGLGIGLEGRLRGEHGWQVLANMGSSPFAPSLTPSFSLHGYWLPHPNWGLDADVGYSLSGTLSSEVGTSLIMWDGQGPGAAPALAHQLRASVGHQTLTQGPLAGYDYGQLTLFRDDTLSIGLASNATLFAGLDGAWRANMDAQRYVGLTEGLTLRLNGSVGTGDPRLPLVNKLTAGLMSQDWLPTQARVNGRLSLLAPLARGLDFPMGPVATLAQVEGNVFIEGAQLWGPENPARAGTLAGVGAEVVLVQDTVLGFPLALSVGYAVPVYQGDGFASPLPGRFYVSTTDAFFPRLKPPSSPSGEPPP
jgi:hypothetical protein